MRPRKGDKRGYKTGGRKKGTPNRRTVARRERIRERLLCEEQLTIDSTIEAIRRGQNFDIRRLYHPDGRLKELHELSEEDAWPIVGVDIVRENAKAGDGHIDTVLKYRLDRRLGYVELAAKYQGMLTEKVELTTDDARVAALLAGRERAAKARGK